MSYYSFLTTIETLPIRLRGFRERWRQSKVTNQIYSPKTISSTNAFDNFADMFNSTIDGERRVSPVNGPSIVINVDKEKTPLLYYHLKFVNEHFALFRKSKLEVFKAEGEFKENNALQNLLDSVLSNVNDKALDDRLNGTSDRLFKNQFISKSVDLNEVLPQLPLYPLKARLLKFYEYKTSISVIHKVISSLEEEVLNTHFDKELLPVDFNNHASWNQLFMHTFYYSFHKVIMSFNNSLNFDNIASTRAVEYWLKEYRVLQLFHPNIVTWDCIIQTSTILHAVQNDNPGYLFYLRLECDDLISLKVGAPVTNRRVRFVVFEITRELPILCRVVDFIQTDEDEQHFALLELIDRQKKHRVIDYSEQMRMKKIKKNRNIL